MDDLVDRLWASDAASALTNEAARRIEALEAALKHIANTFDESWLDGSLEHSIGNRARRALGEPEIAGRQRVDW